MPLKGQDYLILTNSYMEAMNKGAIPVISDAWSSVVEEQLKNAVTKAQKLYHREMKAYLQQNPLDMDNLHEFN